ncbi:MAG: hypothetical protein QNJ22_05425 [Desulfosarcinaceae bacterium]|nr:hypothetical protein [Desulfosarcinaceae bacterium]
MLGLLRRNANRKKANKKIRHQEIEYHNICCKPLTIFGFPVDRQLIFTNAGGYYKKSMEKRQRKLISRVAFLRYFMHYGEKLLFLSTGYSPIGILEQMLTGPLFLFFKRAIFIFTDKRIIHVPTRFNRGHRRALSQILYADCQRIHFNGRALVVTYQNGQRESFPYMGAPELRKLQKILTRLPIGSGKSSQNPHRTALCPNCHNLLSDGSELCPACQLAFKTGFKARLRSLLLPGGGYFYSRNPLPGMVSAGIEILLMGLYVITCLDFANGLEYAHTFLPIMGAAYLVMKLITAFHAHLLVQSSIPENAHLELRRASSPI